MPQGANRSQSGKDERDSAGYFDDAGYDAEPLTHSDLIERFDHVGNAGEFSGASGKESGCYDALQGPSTDGAEGRRSSLKVVLMMASFG